MGTFQAKVQTYLGSGYSETTALSDNLTAGAKQVLDFIPEDKLEKVSVDLTDTGSGVTATNLRILNPHKSNISAIPISKGLKTQATDSTSIHYATSTSPMWYIDAGKAYVIPSGGTINAVAYPSVVYTDSTIGGGVLAASIAVAGTGYAVNDVLTLTTTGTGATVKILTVAAGVPTSVAIITQGTGYTVSTSATTVSPSGGTSCTISITAITNFPGEYEQSVVLYAVIQGCMDLLNDSRVALAALAYVTPSTVPSAPADLTLSSVAPTAPADSSYSYTDATLGTYTSTTIGSLGTPPTYTPPSVTIDGTVWATAYPNYATAIGTALSAISTQAGNGVTAQANVAALLTSTVTAIGLGNAEVDLAKVEAAKMSAEVVLADAETLEAATLIDAAIDTATAAITTANGRINTAVALANVEFDKLATIISEGNTEFDKVAALLATASTTITTSEDLEKGQAQVQQALAITSNGETYLKESQTRIANGNAYLEEARTSLQEAQGYVAEVGARVQQVQGQLSVSGLYLEAVKGYGGAVQSYLGTANGYFTEAQKDLELAQSYSQSAQTYIGLAQAYSVEVQARLANVPAKVSEFTAMMNSATITFQKENVLYQSTIQSAIRQAELDQERLMLTANKTTDLSLQNKAQTLNAAISLYKDKLQRFDGQISLYNASVNAEVQTYTPKLGKYSGQLQLYASQIQDATVKYNLDQQKYTAEINHFQLILNSAKKEFEDSLRGRT